MHGPVYIKFVHVLYILLKLTVNKKYRIVNVVYCLFFLPGNRIVYSLADQLIPIVSLQTVLVLCVYRLHFCHIYLSKCVWFRSFSFQKHNLWIVFLHYSPGGNQAFMPKWRRFLCSLLVPVCSIQMCESYYWYGWRSFCIRKKLKTLHMIILTSRIHG
jgi:hypothetical protein